MAYFRISKKTLDFSFFNSVTFLNFRSSSCYRFFCVNFRRACCSTNSVASSSAAKENNNVSGFRSFAHYSRIRTCGNYCAKFHSLCNKSRMINFCNLAGCKTNLVSVRRKSLGSFTTKFKLRKFSVQSFAHWNSRVASASYAH